MLQEHKDRLWTLSQLQKYIAVHNDMYDFFKINMIIKECYQKIGNHYQYVG